MSSSVLRPHEIARRKFQQAAAEAIDRQASAIQQTREFMADQAVRLDALETRCAVLESGPQTFWARFRWLFTGR